MLHLISEHCYVIISIKHYVDLYILNKQSEIEYVLTFNPPNDESSTSVALYFPFYHI